MMELSDSEVELLRTIFDEQAVYEYIDYVDPECPYKDLQGAHGRATTCMEQAA